MSIRKAAPFTAVSVDNWKRNELNVLSDRHLEQLLSIIKSCVRQGIWPTLLLTCLVSLIPKHEEAIYASDLRPISVFSLLHRILVKCSCKEVPRMGSVHILTQVT